MTGYPLDAALTYLARGWQPLPLLNSGKGLVPSGRTGYSRSIVTEQDVRRWAAQDHDGMCLRLVDCIGLDVDAYDAHKDAAGSLGDLTRRLGPAPLTVRVSARYGRDYDGLSGIRLYRLPDAYTMQQLEQVWVTGFDGIDVIRFGHRQCVVWPSTHPKRGTTYAWVHEAEWPARVHHEPLPPLADLPELPPPWVEACMVRNRPTGPPITVTATELPTGGMCPRTERTLHEVLADPRRHDGWLLKGTTRLARLTEQGHRTGDAWRLLRDTFVAAVTADGSRSTSDAETEWDRAVTGIQLHGTTPPDEQRCCRTRSSIADIRAAIRKARP